MNFELRIMNHADGSIRHYGLPVSELQEAELPSVRNWVCGAIIHWYSVFLIHDAKLRCLCEM